AGLLDLDALLTIRPSDQVLTEGATAGGFDEWVLLANAGTHAAFARVDYLTDAGLVHGPFVWINPGQRTTLHVDDSVTTFQVSTRVRRYCWLVVAERAIYVSTGSHR